MSILLLSSNPTQLHTELVEKPLSHQIIKAVGLRVARVRHPPPETREEGVHALNRADALVRDALGVEPPEGAFGLGQLHATDPLQGGMFNQSFGLLPFGVDDEGTIY